MPPSLVITNIHWKSNLEKEIKRMTPQEQIIARRFQKIWDKMTVDQWDAVEFLLIPALLTIVVLLIVRCGLNTVCFYYFPIRLIIYIITGTGLYYGFLLFLHTKTDVGKPQIEIFDEYRKEYEEIMKEPGAPEVLEKMINAFKKDR